MKEGRKKLLAQRCWQVCELALRADDDGCTSGQKFT